jgi:hypothetical protein
VGERATYGQWSFNGGELSPRLKGRPDQNIFSISAETMVGWLPLLQGPALVAPGTYYVEKAAGACRLFPFEYIPTQGYVIEASAAKFRFYTNDVRIETAPNVAYQVAHGYTLAQLQALDYWQSADVLYLVGGSVKPKKLSRLTAVTFSIADLDLSNGPMEIGNGDETSTVTVSATTGAITVTANTPIFAAGDVGGLFEIVAKDFNDVPSWEPGITGLVVGQLCTWNGRVYQCVGGTGTTGSNPPEHDEGDAWDGIGTGLDVNGKGPYGLLWRFLYGRYGLVRIAGYISPTQVTALVLKTLAASLVFTPTWEWAFGAFSDRRGWPETVGGWNDCLVLTKGNNVYTSVIGDYENFGRRDSSGDFQRDLSGSFTLPKPATINWQASDRLLLIGTDTDEYTVERVQIQTGTPGPPVFDIRLQSSNGSQKTKPVQADGRMLFLQRAGRKLREMGYAISSDRYLAPDMTRLADHIGSAGFVELAWMAEPERLVWAVLGDGTLAAMTYDPGQQVMGWCRRELGADLKAVSACRITDPEGKHDQIWIAADAGGGEYWILRMAKIWEQGDDQQTDQFIVDAGLSYSGAPAQTFSGLTHLNGETVDILADGKVHTQKVVGGGSVTLDYPASHVTIGAPYPSLMKLMPPEAGQSEGVARGKRQRVISLNLQLLEAQGIRVSSNDDAPIAIETRDASVPMNQMVPLYTGLHPVPVIGSYSNVNAITIERYQPTVATVCAIIAAVDVGEN